MSAKKDELATKVKGGPLATRPDYISSEQTGVEDLRTYVTPSRVAVVQKQSDDERIESWGIGTVVVLPDDHKIFEPPRDSKGTVEVPRTAFSFTPLFFYEEWCAWNPIEMKGKVPTIRDRSIDPRSEIAGRARSRDLRKEMVDFGGNQYEVRYVEHLNFIVAVPGVEDPVILSFQKGDHFAGRAFARLITKRKAPIFSCRYVAVLDLRKNDMGSWYGFDIENPEDGNQWVSAEENETFGTLHAELKELHQSSRLRASYDTPVSADSEPDVASKENEFA